MDIKFGMYVLGTTLKNAFSGLFSAVWGVTGLLLLNLMWASQFGEAVLDTMLFSKLIAYLYFPCHILIYTISDIRDYLSKEIPKKEESGFEIKRRTKRGKS